MRVLIDADACPVVRLAVSACKNQGIPCLLFCDTAHQIQVEGAETFIFDKGADSVDFALANRVLAGDLVITQDYGLAGAAALMLFVIIFIVTMINLRISKKSTHY